MTQKEAKYAFLNRLPVESRFGIIVHKYHYIQKLIYEQTEGGGYRMKCGVERMTDEGRKEFELLVGQLEISDEKAPGIRIERREGKNPLRVQENEKCKVLERCPVCQEPTMLTMRVFDDWKACRARCACERSKQKDIEDLNLN